MPYTLNSDPLWWLWQENNVFLPESIREMTLVVEGRGSRSICCKQLWVFLKLNFHLPLSCFDLDLHEDRSLLLPGFHHSVIILYSMKDNLRGELHFSRPPSWQPSLLSCQSKKTEQKMSPCDYCTPSSSAHPSLWLFPWCLTVLGNNWI